MQDNKKFLIPQNRKKDVAVEQVTFEDGKVTIDYYLPEWEMTRELVIDGDTYEKYLKDILALDWSFQVMQDNEYKTDVEGTMSLAEYFHDVDFREHNKDAVSYLKAHHVNYDGLPDIKGAIANICRDYIATIPKPEVHNGHIAQLTTPIS